MEYVSMRVQTPIYGAVSPPPADHRLFNWGGGIFETARRPLTAVVEGKLKPTAPVVMATLRGGADHHEVVTDEGYRYSGRDIAGSISFLPGGCGRRLKLKNVAWQWASITLSEDLLGVLDRTVRPRPFNAKHDAFVLSLLSELDRLHALDDGLDAAYCDAMTRALVRYLARRYWGSEPATSGKADLLPAWRLRQVKDYIEAHLGSEIRVAQLAGLAGLSEGHFHRAFRTTTGQTPLAYITARRIEAAMRYLVQDDEPVSAVAFRVGFVSQSHFARTFRAAMGLAPQEYRRRRSS
jgi:AraC family transcriptional regulator